MASELSVNIVDGSNPVVKMVTLVGEMDESNIESVREQLDPLLNDLGITHLIFELTQQ